MEKLFRLIGIGLIITSSVFALCDDESSDEKTCRKYASAYTTSNDGVNWTCSFNTTTFRYECEGDDGSVFYR